MKLFLPLGMCFIKDTVPTPQFIPKMGGTAEKSNCAYTRTLAVVVVAVVVVVVVVVIGSSSSSSSRGRRGQYQYWV